MFMKTMTISALGVRLSPKAALNVVSLTWYITALFSYSSKPKIFQDFLSHRIFGHMHEVLNIDENKN